MSDTGASVKGDRLEGQTLSACTASECVSRCGFDPSPAALANSTRIICTTQQIWRRRQYCRPGPKIIGGKRTDRSDADDDVIFAEETRPRPTDQQASAEEEECDGSAKSSRDVRDCSMFIGRHGGTGREGRCTREQRHDCGRGDGCGRA